MLVKGAPDDKPLPELMMTMFADAYMCHMLLLDG